MQYSTGLLFLLKMIFIIVFNIIFFLFCDFSNNNSNTTWTAYVFVHVSYCSLICVPKMVIKIKNSCILGLPMYGISLIYFVVILLTSMWFFVNNDISYKYCLTTYIMVTGLYLSIMIVYILANQHTKKNTNI